MGMGSLPYAVHRTILAVDVEKFGDPSRTNVHQVSVRKGLYGALHRSFACSGIPWNACHAEDRGDGALILIPPQVPKNLLAAAVPAELAAALAEHNATAARQARIRLRAVVHAGEVRLDDYGAAGASIIMAFRLLESAVLRSALAESAGVLALMVSEWFFAEVIRHDPDSHPSAFRQVRVTVKETETSAWVCLPGAAGPRRGRPPSSGVAWQDTAAAGSGTSLVVGDIPQQPTAPRPRAELLGRLIAQDEGIPVVFALIGARGVGKTQLAAAVARARIAAGWRLAAWVNAEDRRLVVEGLHQVAVALGLAARSSDAQQAAVAVRHHLEADGKQCLLVFDNAMDPAWLGPFLPAAGRTQVMITSTRRAMGNLGRAVAVDTFTAEESIGYLEERTGLADPEGAAQVASELGYLPLALAQAAGVIHAQGLDYHTYLQRLRAITVADYLLPVPGDPYPRGTAQAVLLSVDGVTDKPGLCRAALDLIAMLSSAGVPRQFLHQAGELGILGASKPHRPGRAISSAAVDALLGRLADASLISISLGDGMVSAHRLVMRVVREQLTHDHHINVTAAKAAALLTDLLVPNARAWAYQPEVDELINQITALNDHLPPGTWTRVPDRELAEAVLHLRERALWYLDDAMTLPRYTIQFGHALVADCQLVRGPCHPDTLAARHNLAFAYETDGQLDEAIRQYEQTAADRAKVLGPDHPDTLSICHNLAFTYRSAGRIAEAVSLSEQVAAARERVQGADHPDTFGARHTLASIYASAGRIAEAVRLGEQAFADRQRVLGSDHPDTLTCRNMLAHVYEVAGDHDKAIASYEHNLAERGRVLGASHADTLASRYNLACCYAAAGRPEEAARHQEQVLADCRRVLGPDHPFTRIAQEGSTAWRDPAAGSGDEYYIRRRRRP
jgi:tetratricopeptide (TPR) repeat protein